MVQRLVYANDKHYQVYVGKIRNEKNHQFKVKSYFL